MFVSFWISSWRALAAVLVPSGKGKPVDALGVVAAGVLEAGVRLLVWAYECG
jgi:hypothetical protein